MTDEGKTAEPTITKADYDKAVERAQKFEAKVADFEKRFSGVDPEAFKAYREEVEILRRESVKGDPKKLEEYEAKIKTELDKRYSGKLGEYESENSKLKQELKNERVISKAVTAAAGRFNSDANDWITHLAQTSLDYEEGKIVVRGEDGKPRPSKVNPRDNMGLEEWLDEVAEKYPSFAKPTGKGGAKEAGQKSGAGSSGEVDAARYLKMSNQERAQLPPAVRLKLFNEVAEAAQRNKQ